MKKRSSQFSKKMRIKWENIIGRVSPVIHVVIRGQSMLPKFREGEHVLAIRKGMFCNSFSAGDIIILRHPQDSGREIIKRISYVFGKEKYFVEGDNKEKSQDSRSFGCIPAGLILGKVLG